jgi:hypothetical protein
MSSQECQEFEIQIEMRLHGALADASALDAHLVTCASCRAFEELGKKTEHTMAETARIETKQIDWKSLRETMKSRLSHDTKARIALFGGTCVAQVAAMSTFAPNKPHFPQLYINWAVTFVLIIGVLAVIGRVERRRLRSYEDSQEDMLFFQRAYLESRLWRTYFAVACLVPFGLGFVFFRLQRECSIEEWIGAVGMMVVYLGISGWLFFSRRPRLLREIAAFKKR